MEQRTDIPTHSGAPSVSGRGPSGAGAGRAQAGLKEKQTRPSMEGREQT
jgi:hypothetical protein